MKTKIAVKEEMLPDGSMKQLFDDGTSVILSARLLAQCDRLSRRNRCSPRKGYKKPRVTGGKL